MFYEQVGESGVRCLLCPQLCLLEVGKSGLCRSRTNIGGKLVAVNYGRSIGLAIDPIEKKPLYHFRPGSQILSLGPNSCNLSCFFCQNFSSSQQSCPTEEINPDELVDLVRRHTGLPQVAFTYTEPLTWYEFIYDFAQADPGIDIVLVTNGFINPLPLKELLPHVRAMNIDLKAIRPEFYSEYCGGRLENVKQSIQMGYDSGTHIELTNLLIPGLNDSREELAELAQFVSSIDRSIPLHISAYHPAYRSSIPETPSSTVTEACNIASQYLDYVYAGNIRHSDFRETRCPSCKQTLITAQRKPVGILPTGTCASCGHRIYGVW